MESYLIGADGAVTSHLDGYKSRMLKAAKPQRHTYTTDWRALPPPKAAAAEEEVPPGGGGHFDSAQSQKSPKFSP